MTMNRIAIAGAGVSGISVVKFFVNNQRFNENFKIDLYDAPKTAGRGYAYQNDDPHLIINLPAEEMSLTADSDDYTNWLKQHGYDAESYTSRRVYGEYMHSTLKSLIAGHDNINVIEHYADNILFNEDTQTYTLKYNDNEQEYDAVFLMTGEMSYSDPYELKGKDNYFYNPYPLADHLNHLQGKIGIIGSGLSAIDSFRYLLSHGHDKVYVLSRSGEMPSVRGTDYEFTPQHFTLDNAFKYLENGLIPLDKLLELFKAEMLEHDVDMTLFERKTDQPEIDLKYDLEHLDSIGRLQYIIVHLQDAFKTLFKYLSRKDKREYLEEYHPYVESNHSPMPPDGARRILRWIDEDKLVFMHGMSDVEVNHDFTVTFKNHQTEQFDILINATGPVGNIEKDNTPLLQNLYNSLLLEADEFGGVLVTKDHEIISPRFGTMPHFYTMGALTAGSDYLIKGVAMLAEETEDLVNHFLNNYED